MRSLEAEYFLRLARVGSVVLAVGVAGFFWLHADRPAPLPPPVDDRVPVILLENASIAVVDEDIETSPAALAGVPSAVADADAGRVGFQPQKVDLPVQKLELPTLSEMGLTASDAAVLVPPK
jgi:hypothetical protein